MRISSPRCARSSTLSQPRGSRRNRELNSNHVIARSVATTAQRAHGKQSPGSLGVASPQVSIRPLRASTVYSTIGARNDMKKEDYMKLEEIIKDIKSLDDAALRAAQARQDTLTKPRGSLGRLEELSIQLAGMKADPFPSVERKAVIVMAADHGVAREGVSAYPSDVTTQMVLNFLG